MRDCNPSWAAFRSTRIPGSNPSAFREVSPPKGRLPIEGGAGGIKHQIEIWAKWVRGIGVTNAALYKHRGEINTRSLNLQFGMLLIKKKKLPREKDEEEAKSSPFFRMLHVLRPLRVSWTWISTVGLLDRQRQALRI